MPANNRSGPTDGSKSKQIDDYQGVMDLLIQLRTVMSSPGSKKALDGFADFQGQLRSKDDELAELKGKLEEQGKKKDIALNEMFEANEKEKTKQKDLSAQIEALGRDAGIKEQTILDQKTQLQGYRKRIDELQSTHSNTEAELGKAQKQNRTLEGQLQEKKTATKDLESKFTTLQQDLSKERAKVEELNTNQSHLKQSLDDKQVSLTKFEGFIAGYSTVNEDTLLDNFSDLWRYATREIWSCLEKDLPKQVLQNRALWDQLRTKSSLAVHHRVPILSSNSPPAKQMRLALVLAILARELHKEVFQPTYLLPEDKQLREVLVKLADSDYEKEAFCRSILLSIDTKSQQKTLQSRMDGIVTRVSSYLYNILPETRYNEFHHILEKVVKKAAEVWQPFQRAKRKYELEFEPIAWGDEEWKPFEFPGANSTTEAQRGPTLLTVFPCIVLLEKESGPITYVERLGASQPLCIAAEKEVTELASSPNTTNGRIGPARARRMSNASSHAGVNGAMPAPTRIPAA